MTAGMRRALLTRVGRGNAVTVGPSNWANGTNPGGAGHYFVVSTQGAANESGYLYEWNLKTNVNASYAFVSGNLSGAIFYVDAVSETITTGSGSGSFATPLWVGFGRHVGVWSSTSTLLNRVNASGGGTWTRTLSMSKPIVGSQINVGQVSTQACCVYCTTY